MTSDHSEADSVTGSRLGRPLRRGIPYLAFAAGVFGYTQAATPFGVVGTSTIIRMEIPVLLLFYGCCLQWVADTPRRPLIAAIPALLLYVAHDTYVFVFGTPPTISQFADIPELFGTIGPFWQGVALLLFVAPLGLFLVSVRPRLTGLVALILLAGIAGLLRGHPQQSRAAVAKLAYELTSWSPLVNASRNGRLVMFIHDALGKQIHEEKLLAYVDRSFAELALSDALLAAIEKRNVHIIVLESFINPDLWSKIDTGGPSAHDAYAAVVSGREGLVIAPGFGNGTANAEFEILCGVPALKVLRSVEFNSFTGAPTNCLPAILARQGYRTVGAHAFNPGFYNRVSSYKGLGFAEIYFPQEYAGSAESYLTSDCDGCYTPDDTMLEQNLTFLRTHFEQRPQTPILNYVLGVDGHFNFRLNESRPVVKKLPGQPAHLERILNLNFYRTKAIANYLTQLMTLDPQGIVLVAADHLPPLPGGKGAYDEIGYLPKQDHRLHLNRAVFFAGGQPLELPRMHHFDLYRMILNQLSAGSYCQEHDCDFVPMVHKERRSRFYDDYMAIMARATR